MVTEREQDPQLPICKPGAASDLSSEDEDWELRSVDDEDNQGGLKHVPKCHDLQSLAQHARRQIVNDEDISIPSREDTSSIPESNPDTHSIDLITGKLTTIERRLDGIEEDLREMRATLQCLPDDSADAVCRKLHGFQLHRIAGEDLIGDEHGCVVS